MTPWNLTNIAVWPLRNRLKFAGASTKFRPTRQDQAALRRRQEEFERHALAAPSTTWAEAAAEARYLILLFAETSEARNPRRQELIAKVLDDLVRLSD
jgi:hypothetical protein